MQDVKNPNIILDVYSSTQVYGDDFKKANDDQFKALYEQAKQLPNVNYIGYKPNEYIKEIMPNYDMFVYPSIFEETSCASALEALASGVHVLTNNFGALYETCAEWPVYINYNTNYESMARDTASAIELQQDIYMKILCKNIWKNNKSSIKDFIIGIKKEWNGQVF